MKLEDKLYTTTEVAKILGVSLRSVYRYLEDGKLIADVKTATGRHRFTKDNILDFLYPSGVPDQVAAELEVEEEEALALPVVQAKPVSEPTPPAPKAPVVPDPVPEPKVEKQPVSPPAPPPPPPAPPAEQPSQTEEDVDWLAKFREAANKFKEEQPAPPKEEVASLGGDEPAPEPAPAPKPEKQTPSFLYYRSMLGGLKEIAQNIDKSARDADKDYAFTLNAGLSLHKPIKPFAALHIYARSVDKNFFEKALRLTPAEQTDAQLCLILTDEDTIYANKEEMHGLFVVSKEQLKKDAEAFGDTNFKEEIESVID
ncbi:helix-turn-helix domain-containing protein [Patescibacteria group bacterium]